MRRAIALFSLLGLLLLAACGDDGGGDAGEDGGDSTDDTEETVTPTTTAEDDEDDGGSSGGDASGDETVCGDLAAVAEIDPGVQPTQDDVDLVRDIAEDLPDDEAAALNVVADVGQFIVDLTPEQLSDPDAFAGLEDVATEEEQAAAGATLVAFAEEECDLSVPLFDDFV